MEITKICVFGKQLQHARKPKSLRATISIEDVNHWPTPSLWMTATFQEFHIPDSISRKQDTAMKRTVQEMMLQRQKQVRHTVFSLSWKSGDIRYISNFRLASKQKPKRQVIFSMPHLHFPHG
jgi:hypothetical protein